jgi:beta-N-acetylhexosaminidase
MGRNSPTVGLILGLAACVAPACRSAAPTGRLTFFPSESRWVEKTLSRMTVEDKVGQLIGLRSSGRFFNREDASWLSLQDYIVRRHVGSLILFGGNVYETAILTNALQSLTEVPLLIASDFERGAGSQVEGATSFPPLMALGAIGSEETAYAMGRITALEGRAMGVHLTYAPVLDVNINPANPIINTRSAGESPELVSRIGKAFIRGCQENGLLATAKHFPGHGDTEVDSHIELAVVGADLERLERVELYPFRQAIDAGVHAVMVSHLAVPALDPTPRMPASLSSAIIQDLLRDKMGFQGLVVSDAMEMGGITTLYSSGEAAVKAVLAGVDLVLLPADADEAIDALIQAVRTGVIPLRRLDESVRRVLTSKAGLGLHRNRLVDISRLKALIASPTNLAAAVKAFEQAVTLVKNDGQLLPLPTSGRKLAVLSLSSDAGDYYAGRTFIQEFGKRIKSPQDMTSFFADAFTGQEFIDAAVAQALTADTIVIGLFSRVTSSKGSVDLNPRHIQAVKSLTAAGRKVVVISFGSPYFLNHFPEVAGYLCAYRQSAEAQVAAVKALFGEIDVQGRLPVTLPGLFPLGQGLNLAKAAR